MLAINRITSDNIDEEPLFEYDEMKANLFSTGIINQYFLMLGDFGSMNLMRSVGEYNGTWRLWVWVENLISVIYFFGSTFLCQVVTLNMLVAIMSATFDRHNHDLH